MVTPDQALTDVYATYELGLKHLLEQLDSDHPYYAEALTYQQRLTENVVLTRQLGDTETRRAERAEILAHLNRLSLNAAGESFLALCGLTSSRGPELPTLDVPHNLPPRSEFIGREPDRDRVHEALGSRFPLVSIDGIGGIGKTSLALEVAYECLSARKGERSLDGLARFDGFIWTSAKDRDLELEDILDTIARTLDYPGVVQKLPEEKLLGVERLLRAKSYLLLVDNFETISDEAVRDFLFRLPEPSKALITTREQAFDRVWAISLKGLTQAEALDLIRSEGRRVGMKSLTQAPDVTLMQLYEATGGIPLAIKWAVGQIKQRGQSLDAVLAALHRATGNVFDQIFGRSWNLLSEEARRVLMVMPLFATSASRDALEAASNVHHFVLDEVLGQLVEMSLVEATDALDLRQRRYSIHPLTRAFSQAKLEQVCEWGQVANRNLVDYFLGFSQENGGFWNYVGFKKLDSELPNLLNIIRWCYDHQLPRQAMDIFYDIADFMTIRGYWNEVMDLGNLAIDSAIELQDEVYAAIFRIWPLSWLLRHRGKLDMAEKQLLQALSVLEREGKAQHIAYAKRNLGRVAHERGEFAKAEEILSEVLEHYKTYGDERHINFVTGNLAAAVLERGNLEKARQLCLEVLDNARRLNDPERLTNLLLVLGKVAQLQGHLAEALSFWQEALENMRRADRLDGIADCLLGVASTQIQMGDTEVARQRLLEALENYRRLDIQPKIEEVNNLLIEIS